MTRMNVPLVIGLAPIMIAGMFNEALANQLLKTLTP
jgi:hypothetical protein